MPEKLKNCIIITSTAFLITGQLVGAGILGIPVVAGIAGFIPALLAMLIFGCAMFFSSMILGKEAADRADPIFNYPSLYQEYLGPFVKWVAIALNMIMLNGLLVAYIAGGSLIIKSLFNLPISLDWIIVAFFIVITGFTITGVSFVRKYNVLLILLLWLSFSLLILQGAAKINASYLKHMDWIFIPMAIPVIVTSYNFCNLIPVVSKGLKWKMSSIWKAIFIGMIIAYSMNAIWLFVGVGVIPLLGSNSLVASFLNNSPATIPMEKSILSSSFMAFSLVFSSIAIVTSYIANGIGLMSFNRDLIVNFTKSKGNRIIVILVTFIPPLLITLSDPNVFIKALGITGGICTVALFGVLPSVIAIIKYKKFVRYLGVIFLCLFISVLAFQIGDLSGIIKIPLP